MTPVARPVRVCQTHVGTPGFTAKRPRVGIHRSRHNVPVARRPRPAQSGRGRFVLSATCAPELRMYGRPMERMPEPGRLIAAFSPLPRRRFRMILGHQLQAALIPQQL